MKLTEWKATSLIFAFVSGITGLLAFFAWQLNDGQWVFPLDDTYIHFSIARQIVQTGIPGLSSGVFEFCTSSPLYTAILSLGFWLFGVNQWLAVLINFLAAGWLIWLMVRILGHQSGYSPRLITAISGLCLLIPLPLIILLGMEHTLQIAINLAFLLAGFNLITGEGNQLYRIILLAALTTAIRYEGVFLVGITGGWMIVNRHAKAGILVWAAGMLPVVVTGIYSLIMGGGFFPTSILGKGHFPENPLIWIGHGLSQLYENPFMLIILIALLLIWAREKQSDNSGYFPGLLALTLLVHVLLAEVGGYRYEAYLIAMGSVVILAYRHHWWPGFYDDRKTLAGQGLRIAGIVFACLPLAVRAGYFYQNHLTATQNIYHQQFQMARFLHDHYPQASVAANDIGAITYFTEIRLTDLVGIGDREVAQIRRDHGLNKADIENICSERMVNIVMVHDIWVGPYLPDTWIKVRSWTIPDNFICADETVSFYGVNQPESALLDQRLEAFEGSLPPSISVKDFFDSTP